MAAVLQPLPGASASTDWPPRVNSRQVLSTRLNRVGGKALAEAIGKDESTASRILSGERGCTVAEFCRLLDLANLKVVDTGKLCVSREQLEFMRRTTARALANEQVASMLFEDPE